MYSLYVSFLYVYVCTIGVDVDQEVEQIVHILQGGSLIAVSPLSHQSVPGQDTKPQIWGLCTAATVHRFMPSWGLNYPCGETILTSC